MNIGDTILVEGNEGIVVAISHRSDGRFEIFYDANGSVLHFTEGDKNYVLGEYCCYNNREIKHGLV